MQESAKEWLAERGYDEEFGARPLKRLFRQEVENQLAFKLLSGSFSEGDVIKISATKEGLIFEK